MIDDIPREVIGLIPARYVERFRIVPLEHQSDVLRVAHPEDLESEILNELALLLGLEIDGRPLPDLELQNLIRQNYGLGAPAIESLTANGNGADTKAEASRNDINKIQTEQINEFAEEAAIVSFVNDLLLQAKEETATDIHIEPFEDTLRVRFRIDGFLHDVPVPENIHHYHSAIVSRIKVMSNLDIAEHRLTQDGRIKAMVNGTEHEYRVSILPTPYGETIDIRVLANASILRGLDGIGLLEGEKTIIKQMLAKPYGVILVTGPTGSGKTTSLYSFLNILNETHRKIITIEDPIEYNLKGVSQIQVHPRIGLTFANGLRSMLRHDPDVMMVGEIRDQETAETVIRVALTGHLVFSTIHTNDAPSTPARLLDMDIEPYLVASSVECILAQRLVRLVCPHCCVPDDREYTARMLGVGDEELDSLLAETEQKFQHGTGCDQCRGTGYRGRTAIFEILPVTREVQDLIMARATAADLRREVTRSGTGSLRSRGILLAATGATTVDEVLRVTAGHVTD